MIWAWETVRCIRRRPTTRGHYCLSTSSTTTRTSRSHSTDRSSRTVMKAVLACLGSFRQKWAILGLLKYLFSSFQQLTVKRAMYEILQITWPLAVEVTALPNEPQPLLLFWKVMIQRGKLNELNISTWAYRIFAVRNVENNVTGSGLLQYFL